MTPDIPTLKQQIFQLKELHEAGALSTPLYEENRALLERQLLDCVLASNASPDGATTPAARPMAAAVVPARKAARLSPGVLAMVGVAVLAIAGAGFGLWARPWVPALSPAAWLQLVRARTGRPAEERPRTRQRPNKSRP